METIITAILRQPNLSPSFKNVLHEEELSQMPSEDDESPYAEDIGMSGYKPWMGGPIMYETISGEVLNGNSN